MNPKGSRGKRADSVVLAGQASPDAAQLNITTDKTQVRRQLEANILEHVTILENAAASLSKDALDRDGRRQAERGARKLAGSLGLFGFPVATEWAREIEQLLQGANALQSAQAGRVMELVATLRGHLEGSPAGSPPPTDEPVIPMPSRRLLIISEDTDLMERVGRDAVAKGMEIQRTTISRLGSSLALRPVIILFDVPVSSDPTNGLASIDARWPEVPVVVLATHDSALARLEGAKVNSHAFIYKPAALSNILKLMDKVIQTVDAHKPKILAVDDDPLILASLQSLLTSYEFALVTHVDPLTLLETLEKTVPDLLILDIDMPDVNGIELCRTVRNHPRWCTLPVLFLTAMSDPQTVDKVFAVRADDYILKPFVGAELLARIRVRLERASTLHQMSDDLHRITISRDDLVAEVKMRKKVEEELQRSSDGIKFLNRELQNTNVKLREFDRRKDEFVNNVSHEIRTPLTIIRESISQVSDGLFGEVPAAQKTYLDKSLVSVDRLVNIINDLLAVAKIENLKLQVTKTKVSMSSLVEDVMSIYETKAQAKGLGLGCELPPTDLYASIDQEKVLQVFGNLISNAIKFTEKGHITISIGEKGEFIECNISDTGKGMAPEDIPKLFNKFEQIGQHQYSSEGTGLGLTISKGIVELHGGNIRVISEEGKGSTFTFTLPKYSFNESLMQNSKKFLVSAIAKFHQFTIVKLTVDAADHQTSNITQVSHSIRACLYRRVDEVFQEGKSVYIVLPDTKKADGRVVIDRIRRELKQQNSQVYLGVQMLSYPEDGSTEDELTIKFEGEKVGAS